MDGHGAAANGAAANGAAANGAAANGLAPTAPLGGSTGRPGPGWVQSLARGISVIRSFDGAADPLTLSEVARRTRLTRATARRFLLTLVDLGYVRAEDGAFSLTPRVLDIGYSYLSSASLPHLAEPHLEQLVATVHESASASVLDGESIVYVARVAVSRIMTVGITIGTRFPAFCTSMGRVLLSGLGPDELDDFLAGARFEQRTPNTITEPDRLRDALDEVRGQGWAYVDQELEEGLSSVAVPVHDRLGKTVAAVNVSLTARTAGLDVVRERILPALASAAREIEADLTRLRVPKVR